MDPGPMGSEREPAPRNDLGAAEASERLARFAATMASRRSLRDFSAEPIDLSLVAKAIEVANSAPSGANLQPWRFVVVTDPKVKRKIREAAEEEEREFYERRAPKEWLDALAPLGTDADKPFLEDAPALIVVFEIHAGDTAPKPYYVKESVGIAVGFLLAALHHAGLATLTHTPSPMRFLNDILDRPSNERPFVLIPVGAPKPDATVPVLKKKTADEVTTWVE